MSSLDTPVYINANVSRDLFPESDASAVESFHRALPGYNRTPLAPLPGIARELNVKGVYVKDESSRFGLPAFKVLGASWGAHCAVAARLGVPPDLLPPDELAARARRASLVLFAATDGNHGRAVAATARRLGLRARIHVPASLDAGPRLAIAREGADVVEDPGDYDAAVRGAWTAAAAWPGNAGVLVQDTSFEGYEDVPARIVEGYGTMLREADEQLAGEGAGDHRLVVVVPVGVGSLAHAVVRHVRSEARARPTSVVTVEPASAACLQRSLMLASGDRSEGVGSTSTTTPGRTIMTGMDCGTVSHAAWPDLRRHVRAACAVSDIEAHRAVEDLAAMGGVASGPCGAAGLAALRRLAVTEAEMCAAGGMDDESRILREDSVVLLLNTEGPRSYEVPADEPAR